MFMRKPKRIGSAVLALLCVTMLCSATGCQHEAEVSGTPVLPTLPSGAVPTGTSETTAESSRPSAGEPSASDTTASETKTTTQAPSVPDSGSATPGEVTRGQTIVSVARSLLGRPFAYGKTGPDAFDNSGFVYYCFRQAEMAVPRLTQDMYAGGKAVERGDLIPGDLVFFTMSDVRQAEYVGIYVGDGEFIACSNEERPVDVLDMTWSYFEERFIGARRYVMP